MHSTGKVGAIPGRRAYVIRALIALTAGLLLRFRFGHVIGGTAVLCIACMFAVAVAMVPLRRGLHAFEKKLTHIVGSVLTIVLLVPFFYLCMLPGRIFLLLAGKDPLHRELDPEEESYWTPIDRTSSREQYRRQS